MRGRDVLASLGLALVAAAAGAADPQPRPPTLRIGAEMSIRPAMERLATWFEQTRGVPVAVRDPDAADTDAVVLASPEDMDALERAGRIVSLSRRDVARNRLVIISAPGGVYPRILHDLLRSDFELVAVADPATLALGRYTAAALAHMDLESGLSRRLFRADSSRRLIEYVATGQVPAAIVYTSDAHRNHSRVVRGPEFPAEASGRIIYQAAITTGAAQPDLAATFLNTFTTPEVKKILTDEGITPVP